jgi:hypothetical protein
MFPERSFQLEHFYLPLYYLKNPDFRPDIFIEFIKKNHMAYAVGTSLHLVAALHNACFGFVPEVLENLKSPIAENERECSAFMRSGLQTPYMFTLGLTS